MSAEAYFLIITILFTVFLIGVLYLANSMSVSQVQELKAKGTTEYTNAQTWAITAAQVSFTAGIGLTLFTIGLGFGKWLLS
jgi:hypothetical protein